jgi:hypothetical protein
MRTPQNMTQQLPAGAERLARRFSSDLAAFRGKSGILRLICMGISIRRRNAAKNYEFTVILNNFVAKTSFREPRLLH